jgi:hypothetical protein
LESRRHGQRDSQPLQTRRDALGQQADLLEIPHEPRVQVAAKELAKRRLVAAGRPLALDLQTYKIPTALDMPRLVSALVARHEPTGPFGAQAIAEIPIDGPAPAIANAVFDAVGVRIRELPITPEKVLAGIRERQTAPVG